MAATSVGASGSSSITATAASTLSSSSTHIEWGSKGCNLSLYVRESSLELFTLYFLLFRPTHLYCMLLWAFFGALVFWYSCDPARLQACLFAGLHCYFCYDYQLRVQMISVFSVWYWNYRKLFEVFIYRL